MSGRFPVLWQGPRARLEQLRALGCPRDVPWAFIANHADMCLRNHDQTPERLAQRGGLSPAEMVCVVSGLKLKKIFDMSAEEEVSCLLALLDTYATSAESGDAGKGGEG